MAFMERRYWWLSLVLTVVMIYLVSYGVMSRLGFYQADACNVKGFYFIPPTEKHSSSVNRICRIIYWPLIKLDNLIGTGRKPADDPLEGLNKTPQ
jgi:hypothetical protein